MQEREYSPRSIEINKLDKLCGIYQIRNILNNHVYIGSSKNLKTRYLTHFMMLKNQKHENPALQNVFNKHGLDSLNFEVIELCEEKDQYQIEQYWINKFYGKECYNINPFASKPPNCKGMKRNRKTNPNCKPVICVETKERYFSAQDAIEITGFSNIRNTCKNQSRLAGNYHWMYEKDYKKLSDEDIQKILLHKSSGREIICLETKERYINAKVAAINIGLDETTIRLACRMTRGYTKNGFHWMYYDEYLKASDQDIQEILNKFPKSVRRCICVETGKIYPHLKAAGCELGVTNDAIRAVCEGTRGHVHGYHFEFLY